MPRKKKLDQTVNIPAPEQASVISTLSQVSSMVSSASYSTYHYLTTPEPFPPKPSSGRHTTPFAANIVASLALPEYPKPLPKVCKKYHSTAVPPSYFSKAASFFTWLLTPAPATIKSEPALVLPIKERVPSPNDIDIQMKKLVAEALKQKDQKIIEEIYLQKIDLVEYEIMEHAQRRVDLYFYLLVAVYKSGANVVKVFTQKQHGVGSEEKGTNACHDSFFPNVLLQYPQTKLSFFWSSFVTLREFQGTHFEDVNNMTTELPAIVNYFDTYMEFANPGHRSRPSHYVNQLLKDLNLVSRGEKTPLEAMNSFLATMHIFFFEFEEKFKNTEKSVAEDKSDEEEKLDKDEKRIKLFKSMPKVMQKIYGLQKTGTLRAQASDSLSIDHEYICSLLRVPPDQVLATRQDPSLLLNTYCPIIQNEIFATKSVIGADRKIIKPANKS